MDQPERNRLLLRIGINSHTWTRTDTLAWLFQLAHWDYMTACGDKAIIPHMKDRYFKLVMHSHRILL
jgi:hypothetical protein